MKKLILLMAVIGAAGAWAAAEREVAIWPKTADDAVANRCG